MHVSSRDRGRRALFTLSLLLLGAAPVAAQNVGKIEGRVVNAQTRAPLAGAQVFIVGTNLGNITNADGYYFINNVPAEVHDIRAQYLGFQTVTVVGQRVLAGQTVTINFELPTTAIALEPIEIIGEVRPLVPRDQVASKNIISGEIVRDLPVDNVREVLKLMPGVVDVTIGKGTSIRGGRSGEEAVYVDGLLLRNFNFGESRLALAPAGVAEIDVLTGGFSAEFGEAQSGIINFVTRQGAQAWSGAASIETDEVAPSEWSVGLNRLQASVGGPIAGPVSFFGAVTGQGQRSIDTGRRWRDVDIWVPDGFEDEPVRVPASSGSGGSNDQREVLIPRYTLFDQGGRFPYTARDLYSLDGKLDLTYGAGSRAYISGKQSRTQNRAMSVGQLYNPMGRTGTRSNSRALILGWTHNFVQTAERALALDLKLGLVRDSRISGVLDPEWALDNGNPRLGFTFGDMQFLVDEKDFPVNEELVENYVRNRGQRTPFDLTRTDLRTAQEFRLNPYGVATGFSLTGLPGSFAYAKEQQIQLRAAIDWQAGRYNRVKIGGDFTSIDLAAADITYTTQSFAQLWVEKPKRSSLFITDRLDLGDLIVEGGLRWDRFDPASNFPIIAGTAPDPDNPASFAAAKVENELSPRLGVSFPVTENSTFRLSYGHFVQLPDLNEYYRGKNIDYFRFGNTNTNDVFGRPLQLGKTIAFEFGYRVLLSPDFVMDVAAYNRDKLSDVAIRKLAWTNPVTGTPEYLNTITNSDFGSIRGADIRFDRRFGRLLDVMAGYSYQDARSTGTDPFTYTRLFARIERNANQLLGLPPNPAQAIRLTEENRTHNLTGYFSLHVPQDWERAPALRNVSLSGTFRMASGLPYSPLKDVGVQLPVGPPSGVFEGSLKYDEISTSRLPWTRELDVKLSRRFQLSGLASQVYVDVRNLLDFENRESIFLSTGDVADESVWGQLVDAHMRLVGGGNARELDLSSLGSAGAGVTNEVNLVALQGAEKRYGNGDGVFSLAEQRAAFRQAVLLSDGPQWLIGSGRRLRLGVEVTF